MIIAYTLHIKAGGGDGDGHNAPLVHDRTCLYNIILSWE